MHWMISGAFGLGIGIERIWPAAEYGGAGAQWWIIWGLVFVLIGTVAEFRR